MQRQYSVPVQAIGTEHEVSPGDFQIARIAIDNPSQCWLYLSGINAYIPPQTLSRVLRVNPTQSRIDVRFVTAPTGGVPSVATGDPVTVIAYDSESPDVAGTDFGLLPAVIDLTDAIADLQAAIDNLRSGWGTTAIESMIVPVAADSVTVSLVAPPSGSRLVVDGLVFAWACYDGPVTTPRGFLVVQYGFPATPGSGTHGAVTLTPETPTIVVPVVPGAVAGGVGPGFPFQVNVSRYLDSLTHLVNVSLTYHLVTP